MSSDNKPKKRKFPEIPSVRATPGETTATQNTVKRMLGRLPLEREGTEAESRPASPTHHPPTTHPPIHRTRKKFLPCAQLNSPFCHPVRSISWREQEVVRRPVSKDTRCGRAPPGYQSHPKRADGLGQHQP